nr:AbrB family transcriptional regulator [Saprospiraceae bacterium]
MGSQLTENSLLLLFLVAAIGYLVGSIRIKGATLGVAAVLFVGLAFGMINPNFQVPEIIFQLGLILFVYSIGISSGSAFFQSFKKNGYRDMLFVMIMLAISAVMAVAIHYIFGFDKATTTGLYSGSSTNTTALAAVTDLIGNNQKAIQNIVVGYTYSYPMGVIGVMIVLKVCEKLLKVDYVAEKKLLRKDYPVDTELSTRSVKVTNEFASGRTLRDILRPTDWNLVFSRVTKGSTISLVHYDTVFELGDTLMMIGSVEDLEKATVFFGEETTENLYYDRKEYDVQQIFVSNPKMVGRTIASLHLNSKYDAIITRIRRGDTEMLAQPQT